jgi:hypothetical protein
VETLSTRDRRQRTARHAKTAEQQAKHPLFASHVAPQKSHYVREAQEMKNRSGHDDIVHTITVDYHHKVM